MQAFSGSWSLDRMLDFRTQMGELDIDEVRKGAHARK